MPAMPVDDLRRRARASSAERRRRRREEASRPTCAGDGKAAKTVARSQPVPVIAKVERDRGEA